MRDVQGIPPAPRQVRLGTLLACRWPLLALGSLLTVYGGLWTLMLWFAAGAKPSDQHALDRGPVALADGEVLGVDAPVEVGGRRLERVHYRFTWAGQERPSSHAFAEAGTLRAGDPVPVELLPANPAVNRIRGTILHVEQAMLQPTTWLGTVVVPGCLLLLGWLAGVFHLRRVIVYGDVSVGTVTAVKPLRFLLPACVAVQFTFKDHHAQERRGRHWVRAHSRLGLRLLRALQNCQLERLPVLHDRQHPQWSRLALPDDFAVPAATAGAAEAARE